MTQPQLNQRLTSVDASFLYFERKEAPLHIGSTNVFEREIPFEEFVEFVSSKMPFLPRYRQKVVPVPYNVAHPTWEFDPNFNIRNHVFEAKVKAPGSIDQLRELSEEIQRAMLDRSKPLWEMYLVNGLEGGRSALIAKVHHAMVDGVSGIDLIKIIMSITPDPAPVPVPAIEPPPPPPDDTRRLIDGILDNAQEGMKSLLEFQSNLLNLAQSWLKLPAQSLVPPPSNNLTSLVSPVSLLPFNRANSGRLKNAWSEFSFAEARAIRGVLGGTVNDVVLTALSGAIIKYLELHRQKTTGRTLRVMVPVSMRKEDQRGALGNLVSVLPVEIPLDLADHVERYNFINKKTGSLKGAKVAEGLNVFSALLGTVPASLQAVIGSIATTQVPVFNIVSTNVPGPQIPLYVLGRRMVAYYPFVPVGFAVGVSCAIVSYDQKLYFGITSDEQAMPDLQKLKEFLDQSFAELRSVAGVAEIKTPAVAPPTDKPRTRTRTRKAPATS
jgi:WS/DGAT/MGAT family acyltransferase